MARMEGAGGMVVWSERWGCLDHGRKRYRSHMKGDGNHWRGLSRKM